MKKSNNFLLLILLALLLPNITIGQYVFESFELETRCNNLSLAFFNGCYPDWISVSGSPDAKSNHPGVTALHGSHYVRMYTKYSGQACENSPIRGESIAINYDFQAGQEYTVNYAFRWENNSGIASIIDTRLVLTNDKGNQNGSLTGCDPGEILPPIDTNNDEVVGIHMMPGNQNNWQTLSSTFTASENFSQLWIRPEFKPTTPRSSTETLAKVYLDAFEIETCVPSNFNTNFDLWVGSNPDREVTVNTDASGVSNPPVPQNHWWGVFKDDSGEEGLAIGNTQIGYHQCCNSLTAEFTNGLFVNQYYYMKHGIWNECTPWDETRIPFDITIGTLSTGEPTYEIKFKDIDFKPSEAYLAKMNEMVSNLSSEEIRKHNQTPLNFKVNPTASLNTITNYPNPFNGTTTIEFNLEKEENVTLKVFDLTGRTIATLLENDPRSKGRNQVLYDGSNLNDGVYFYTIQSNGFKETKKMIFRK